MPKMILIMTLLISLTLTVPPMAGQAEAYFILYEDLDGNLFGFDTQTT